MENGPEESSSPSSNVLRRVVPVRSVKSKFQWSRYLLYSGFTRITTNIQLLCNICCDNSIGQVREDPNIRRYFIMVLIEVWAIVDVTEITKLICNGRLQNCDDQVFKKKDQF